MSRAGREHCFGSNKEAKPDLIVPLYLNSDTKMMDLACAWKVVIEQHISFITHS